jgi:hypothetical protein
MKVYIVTKTWYEAFDLVAAFYNKNDAVLFIEQQQKPINYQIHEMDIE